MKTYYLFIIVAVFVVILLMSSSPSSFSSPTSSGKHRKCDGWGCGHYKAPRGDRLHMGVDYFCNPGDSVFSPIDGYVSRYAIPYSDDSRFKGIEVVGSGVHFGFSCKIFYMVPSLAIGSKVSKGKKIGVCQDLNIKYPGITSHIHLELYKDGVNVNPSSYI